MEIIMRNSGNKNSITVIKSREDSEKNKLEKCKIRPKICLRRNQEEAQEKKKLGPDESEKKKCLYFKGKNANKKLMIDTINSKN